MKYVILGIMLVILLVVLFMLRIILRNAAIRELGLEYCTRSVCTLKKIINVGNDSVFKNLPKRFNNQMLICSKNEEIVIFMNNAGKKYATEHTIRFNRDDIIKTTSKKSLNMRIYTIKLNTEDVFELWISDSNSKVFSKILKSEEE